MIQSTHAKASLLQLLSVIVLPLVIGKFAMSFFIRGRIDRASTGYCFRLMRGSQANLNLQIPIHLSFVPFDNWSFGVSRTLQFGGGNEESEFYRCNTSYFQPIKLGKDNVGDYHGDDPHFEFGNQLASVTSKVNFNWGMPVSIYAEIAAEDTDWEKKTIN